MIKIPTQAELKIIDFLKFLLLFLIFFTNGQVYSLRAQDNLNKADSVQISDGGVRDYLFSRQFSTNFQPLRFEFHEIELRYPIQSYQTFLNQSLSNLSVNPFTIDYRESSIYVPTMVRDELNLMMNRPKDSAFMPILGVAWLAYQLGSKYLEIQKKISVGRQELLNAYSAMPLLFCLWQKYPQTAHQLYDRAEIQSQMTFKQLQQKLDLLQQNNLIKRRFYTADSTQYFPNVVRSQMESITEAAGTDLQLSETDKAHLQFLHQMIIGLK